MPFPILGEIRIGEEDEFLADFVSYPLYTESEGQILNVPTKYVKLNDGDTVKNLNIPDKAFLGIAAKSFENRDGTDYTFPNKIVKIVVIIQGINSSTTLKVKASDNADTDDGTEIFNEVVNDGDRITIEDEANYNGKYLTAVAGSASPDGIEVRMGMVIEPA